MIKLIVKKEKYDGWLSLKKIIECNKLTYHFKKWYYEKKGYEVEVIEE